MATATPNYGLRLPSDDPVTGDTVDVDADISASMLIIDAELKAIRDILNPLNSRVRFDWLETDQTVNNQASYFTIPSGTFSIPVEANSTYAFEAFLLYKSSATADFKFDINAPAGTTYFISPEGVVASANSGAGSIDKGVNATSNQGELTGRGTALFHSASPIGTLFTAATAGSIVLQFAQVTAEASNTVLCRGTWIRLTKLN